jgi:transcriptional regulator with XRE-family HTH domain
MPSSKIGEEIRQLRLKKGLSLSEFARRTGMSKSMVSQVERGTTNPSVESVRTIAATLEVPVFSLFLQGNDSQDLLVRQDRRITLTVPDSKIVRQLITPDLHRAMVLLVACIPPHESSSPTFTTHLGEECIYVLRGTVTVHLQAETYDLNQGDSFYFPALQPHYFSNPTDTESEFLSSIVPPTLNHRPVRSG